MAKKPKVEADESPLILRAKLEGALVACIRYEGKRKGLQADVEIVRHILTDRYTQMGWLREDESGEVHFQRPAAGGE